MRTVHFVPASFFPAQIRLLATLLVATCLLALGNLGVGRDADAGAAPPDVRTLEDMHVLIDDLVEARSTAAGDDDDDDGDLQLPTLKFFIELNETDADVGVQTLLGGEPYKRLRAYDPEGRRIIDLRPRGSLKTQGLSDFFHESAEPTIDELPFEVFFDRFPEGIYAYETVTIDNIDQDGETLFTHLMPAGPVITAPQEGDVVNRNKVVVEWEPVTLTTPLNPPQVPVTIVGYQVIVTRAEAPNLALSIDLPPDVTSISISPEFFEAGTEYELEVLAIEESDNQTISIIFFDTDE